jgi:hypothetical protein
LLAVLTVFAVGEGDAAGEGLVAAGLGLVAGGVVVSLLGEAAAGGVDGDDVLLGVFEFVAGSQAAAKAIVTTVASRRVMRVVDFIIELLIWFASFGQD